MASTKSLLGPIADHPGNMTLFPAEYNPGKRNQFLKINATADTANLHVGALCYLTGTTNENDVTEASADYGDDSREGLLFIVQPDEGNPHFAYTTEFTTHVPPNTTCTIADYKYSANDEIRVALLEPGDILYVMGSTDGTFDTVFGYEYICAASGLIAAVDDPDGVAIDQKGHLFTALQTRSNMNWALVRYEGIKAFDGSA